MKVISFSALGPKCPSRMLCCRFFLASFVAVTERSTPHSRISVTSEERRRCRRSVIQPVPVQRSRMRRRCVGCWCMLETPGTRVARWTVRDSVSGLRQIDKHKRCESSRIVQTADLGMSTPALHIISRSPKGCEPKIYCNGFPLSR